MRIKGLTNITNPHRQLLIHCNVKQMCNAGGENVNELRVVETWVDDGGTLCAKLKNGKKYRYYLDGSWEEGVQMNELKNERRKRTQSNEVLENQKSSRTYFSKLLKRMNFKADVEINVTYS